MHILDNQCFFLYAGSSHVYFIVRNFWAKKYFKLNFHRFYKLLPVHTILVDYSLFIWKETYDRCILHFFAASAGKGMSNATKEFQQQLLALQNHSEMKAKCENETILHICKLCVKDEEF